MRRKSSIIAGVTILGFLLTLGAAFADVQYYYNSLNRLIRVQYEDGTNVLFSYDEAGNRIGQVVGPDPAPPAVPSNPSLANGTVNVPLGTDLSWTGGDPDGDSVTYTLFLDTNSHPTSIAASGQSTTYRAEGLACGTTYYWSVTSVDQYGAITYGPVWSFTTDFGPPVKIQRSGSTLTYSTLQDAYTAAANGEAILSQNIGFMAGFNANRDISVTIEGGYDCTFTAKSGMTTIKGAPRISYGTVTMRNFRISN